MAEYLIQKTTLTSIADAIREKTGTTGAIKPTDMASKIGEISVGGGESDGSVKSKAINFYDPMGNIIYSYTRAEAAALTELPPGPQLEGFEFSGWTHTLSNLQSEKFFADVGPLYTLNGKNVGILIVDVPAHNLTVTVNAKCSTNNTGAIDWMDGSAVSTIPSTSTSGIYSTANSHTYASAGIKYIAVYATSGRYVSLGGALIGGSARSPIGSSDQSKDKIVPEYTLLSIICAPDIELERAIGHERLRFIASPNHNWNSPSGITTYIHQAPCLETIAIPGVYCTSRYLELIHAPKLRRIKTYLSYSSGYSVDEALLYMGSVTDVYLDSNSNIPSVMNVKRRVIVNATTPKNKVTTTIQWGSGDIYVPDDAVETYKANALFATVADCIKPISEYPDY